MVWNVCIHHEIWLVRYIQWINWSWSDTGCGQNEVFFVININWSIQQTPVFGSRYHYIHSRQQIKLSNSVNGPLLQKLLPEQNGFTLKCRDYLSPYHMSLVPTSCNESILLIQSRSYIYLSMWRFLLCVQSVWVCIYKDQKVDFVTFYGENGIKWSIWLC